ncbi:hypothetical protein BDZ90DRAFT_257741 [Jaminaea rosea]|uniref:Tyr recombinase domain-containing protein n=1 Tax=Jaminaea rosea TaxID=1569628 RepID=A0A316V280_9BASI|nr:hypothetical protein BDZ90DRAFT_257741 [Jaminaea rosea]PWN30671.1 hypothetical protein BDZ90DRAFT_257741 [Jaminaea rosea]
MRPQSHPSRRSRRQGNLPAIELALPAPARRRTTPMIQAEPTEPIEPIDNRASAVPAPDIDQQGRDYIAKHGKSERTLQDYSFKVGRVQAWLDEQPVDPERPIQRGLRELNQWSEEAVWRWLAAHSELLRYDNIKNYHSALAQHFHATFHCSHQKSSGWRWVNGVWEGNPVYSERYLQLKKSIQRSSATTQPPVRHALPMLYPKLEKLLDILESKQRNFDSTPNVLSPQRTHTEFMYAFMVLAYRLWMRCDEACKLVWGEVEHVPVLHPETETFYVSVTLTWRKNNQLDAANSRPYMLFDLPQRPKVSAIQAVVRWRKYWTWVHKRTPEPQDLVFPGYHPRTGQLDVRRMLRAHQVNSLLDQVFNATDTIQSIGLYRYTSHSFRRGGAQDAFIWANNYGEPKKSLAFVRWWGGWGAGESLHTIERYVINVMSEHEGYFGDMENPLLLTNRREHWCGGDSGVVAHAVAAFQQAGREQREWFEAERRELTNLITTQQQLLTAPTGTDSESRATGNANLNSAPHSLAEASAIHPSAPQPTMEGAFHYHSHSTTNVIINVHGKPMPQKIPKASTVLDVVSQWELGDPSNGLTPLREWVPAMRQKGEGGNASLYTNRKKIYDAYLKRGANLRAFYQAYGGEDKKLGEYIAAIDKEAAHLRALAKGAVRQANATREAGKHTRKSSGRTRRGQ